MAYLLKLGTYTLPPTFYVARWPMARVVPQAKLARADGSRVIAGYLDGKTFGVRGSLVDDGQAISTGTTDLRTQLDNLRAGVAQGMVNFQAWDDRFFRCAQVGNFEESYTETAFGAFAEVSFDVIVGDPFAYEVATQNATEVITASGQTLSVTAAGNAYALPTLSITANGTGTMEATITNMATGEIFTLTGIVAAGEVIVVNSLTKTVTKQADGTDLTPLFDGLFPRLLPGANVFNVTYLAGGPPVSNIAVAWSNRWY